MTIALDYVAALIGHGDTKFWLRNTQAAGYFRGEAEESIYKFVSEFVQAYGAFPTLGVVSHETSIDLPAPGADPSGWYLEKLRLRHVSETIMEAGAQAGKLLSGGGKDPDAAMEVLRGALYGLTVETNRQSYVPLPTLLDSAVKDWKAKQAGQMVLGMGMGWPSVDQDGGLEGGDLGSIVGRPATGKTWFTLFMALYAWKVEGRAVLFNTQEMPASQIGQRLLAMHTGLPFDPIKKNLPFTEAQEDAMVKAVLEIDTKVPFHILDSKLGGTVADTEAFARSMGAEAVFWDGAYLIKHPDPRLNRYQRVAENVDLMKAMLLRLDIPGVASWQFSREAAKTMKKTKGDNKPDLDEIGYSDAIGQHSSTVLGLLQPDKVETSQSREISILKGRSGEMGDFHVSWDFLNMDFGEIENASDLGAVPQGALAAIPNEE